MDHLCARCTRQALQSARINQQRSTSLATRAFSQSAASFARPIDLSRATPGSDKSTKPSQSASAKPSSPSNVLTRSAKPSSPPGAVLTRKTGAKPNTPSTLFGRTLGGSSSNTSNSPGVLTRSGPPRGDRTNPPSGQFLRRSGPPRTGFPSSSSSGPGGRPPGTSFGKPRSSDRSGPRSNRVTGGRLGGAPRTGPNGAPLTDEEIKQLATINADATSSSAKLEAARNEHIDDIFEQREVELYNANLNSGLPITDIPYEPAEQTLAELRKDWPDLAWTQAGLVEGVVQKLNFLARSLPHDYWTPKQVAERFLRGQLVKFGSEEEKEKVLEYAARIVEEERESAAAKKKDGTVDESSSGGDVEASQGFTSVTDSGNPESGTQPVIDAMVKGIYPQLQTGNQRVLLSSVMRQLRNNGTYGAGDTRKFVGRIEALIVGMKRQGQQGSASQKTVAA